MSIIAFERFNRLVNNQRLPTDRAATFFEELSNQVNKNTPLSGSGSPEGNIVAPPGRFYYDTGGTPGSILYVKQSGVGNTGWVLV